MGTEVGYNNEARNHDLGRSDCHRMSYLLICTVAFLASGLTFFSGFGLGTLLLPAFALFFSIEQSIAMTAVVHFLNGLFKLVLVWRGIDWRIVLRFGLPAMIAAVLGAWVLTLLSDLRPIVVYQIANREMKITAIKLAIGLLLLFFAAFELIPRLRDMSFGPRYLSLGGLLSGFFGGLSGMQGALRSAFLVRAGLSKTAYVASGVAIACLIDISRLGVYAQSVRGGDALPDLALLTAAVLAAFAGAALGNRFLSKLTVRGIQRIVAAMLFVMAVGMIIGAI
jgi:uncharacterized membrane protein YfcA